MIYIQRIGLLLTIIHYATAISCKNDNGDNVDMWVILKQPSEIHYVYYDSNSGFAESSHSLNDTKTGALASTLVQLWETNMNYILYNDENPTNEHNSDDINVYNYTVGHTKAVYAFDDISGFILQHSVPNFPLGPSQVNTYMGLPSSAWTYGQSFLCFSTNITSFTTVALLAQLMIPNIYDYALDKTTSLALQELVHGAYSKLPVCNTGQIYTSQNMPITVVVKSSQWNNELWAYCVAPFFKANLNVESWVHGEPVGPTCNQYTILDIQELSYPGIGTFSEYYDHSKWAVGITSQLICFGDINRMLSQYERGGSTYCFYDTQLWNYLHNSIINTDSC